MRSNKERKENNNKNTKQTRELVIDSSIIIKIINKTPDE